MNAAPPDGAAMVRDAFTRGQTALAAGDKPLALKWLERAHRLAGDDGTIALSLASALIGHDNVRATALFARVLDTWDIRDAWAGLILGRFLTRDLAGARDGLDVMLRRHAPHPDLASLASQIVSAAGAPGRCGLTAAGALRLQPTQPVPIEVRIDGKPLESTILPPSWPKARRIDVVALTGSGERHFLGSPIAPTAIAALEGYAEAGHDGISGWAWHPADPDTDPVLSIHRGRHRSFIAAPELADGVEGLAPLARPRRFLIPWAALPASGAAVHLRGPDGRDLTGSPVVLTPPPRLPRAARPVAGHKFAGVRVIVRASDDPAATRACLDALLASLPASVPVLLHGAPPPPGLRARVSRCDGDILSFEANQDLVMADGIAAPPPDWLDRLRSAAYASKDTASVTPFSNRGQAAYPFAAGVPLAWFGDDPGIPPNNNDQIVRIPSGGGPCWYVRGDCLAAAGPVRVSLFGTWDAAQRDFSARASAAGWRHAALPGLFVAQSADPVASGAAMRLRQRDAAWLNGLYPPATEGPDPLHNARRTLDLARWRALPPRPSVILLTHGDGGGVERRIAEVAERAQAQGKRAIILRPAEVDGEKAVTVQDGLDQRYPNLRLALPHEKAALARLLRESRPVEAEIHHFLNHDPSVFDVIRAARVPYDVHVHDFIWFCPRVALVNVHDRYCGEPDRAGCEACIAEGGDLIAEDIAVPALLDRSRTILSAARAVIAPSRDAADRMMRHFPGLPVTPVPHEDDRLVPEPPPVRPLSGRVRVCVAGAIGLHKGYWILLACARDARRRGLDLEFIVVGTTIDDQRLIDTGRVFVTGRYEPHEAVALIAEQQATLALLPSIWPETWCLGLTEIWRAGLRVVAFDTGAPAERIRRTGRGMLIPLGSSPRMINDTLLNVGQGRSVLPIRRSSAYKTAR